MFSRFTDRARKVMALARKQAQRFNHDFIETEHMLLGLLEAKSGVAYNIFLKLKVDVQEICKEIEKRLQIAPSMTMMGHLPFTASVKITLELALESANELDHDYIGTAHLLCGLIRENNGVAAQILRDFHVTLQEVMKHMKEKEDSKKESVVFSGEIMLKPRVASCAESLINAIVETINDKKALESLEHFIEFCELEEGNRFIITHSPPAALHQKEYFLYIKKETKAVNVATGDVEEMSPHERVIKIIF